MCLDFNFVLQLISDPSQTSVPNQVRTRAGLPEMSLCCISLSPLETLSYQVIVVLQQSWIYSNSAEQFFILTEKL